MINGKTGKHLSMLAVFCAGLFLTVAVAHLAYKAEEARVTSLFNDASFYRFKYIEDIMQKNTAELESFSDFYAASDKVNRDKFSIFANGVLSRNPSIIEIRWLQRVRDAERAAFELDVRESGIADFYIKQLDKGDRVIAAGKREEYYSVRYIVCAPGHNYDDSLILGLDASSFPERLSAMRIARDTGRPSITDETKVVGETNMKNASRLFMPIYRNGLAHDTVRARGENLTGFVAMIFRTDKMVEGCLANIPPESIDIAIYQERSSGRKLLYFRPSPSRRDPHDPSIEKDLMNKKGSLLWSHPLPMAGGDLLIVCSPSPEFADKYKIILPWTILLVGLALTLMLTFYLKTVVDRTKIVEMLVEQRTEELRFANKEWTDTFNAISDFVFILDSGHIIKKANKVFLDALHLKEEDAIGRECYEVVHRMKVPWMNCPQQKTIADKKPHTEEVDDPGLGMPLLITTSPIFDEKGGFIGSIHIAKDVSVMKKTEEGLRKAKEEIEREARDLAEANEGIKALNNDLAAANEQLKKLDKLKSDFVSVVSHELRTPLAIMKEGVALVLDNVTGNIGVKTRSTLDMVASNINRLVKLINDILDISKIESGKVQMNKVVADISVLVRETAEKWKLEADKKDQVIIISTPLEKLEAYFDMDKVIQVMNNLLSNAIKFTPEKGRITVKVHGGKDSVEVSVSDDGVGISKEDMGHVFEKFRQFNRTAGSGAKGTGLGLAISRELVMLHEGTMGVESEPGKGTKFTFTLPKKDTETIFRERVAAGIEEAATEEAELSIISIRMPEILRLRDEIGIENAQRVLEEMEVLAGEQLRKRNDPIIKGQAEFVIILIGADDSSAKKIMQRVESAIRSYLASSPEKAVKELKINVGVATYPQDASTAQGLLDKVRGIIKA